MVAIITDTPRERGRLVAFLDLTSLVDLIHALLLALIQGITEFLPISSSAHLILPFKVLGWPDQGLAFDVAVHLGSLLAVMAYFRRDLIRLIGATLVTFRTREWSTDSRFAFNLLIASLPIIPAGFFLKGWVESDLRAVEVIIATTIIFGVALLIGDRLGRRCLDSTSLTWQHALAIGLAQCLALVPGTSRSGITMTMALLAGYTREACARISFLLSIPAIAGAATLSSIHLLTAHEPVDWTSIGTGFIVAGLSAYACITLFLEAITRMGFLPFVIYRLALGGALFLLVA
ncbi:MAG: undecaprenyl-diphosphate phosphatase [Gammaproteobacteria bacterium]|nr:undecaprenyl-diphosphate phosphatase [Gammaproteobacteria bacterium]